MFLLYLLLFLQLSDECDRFHAHLSVFGLKERGEIFRVEIVESVHTVVFQKIEQQEVLLV